MDSFLNIAFYIWIALTIIGLVLFAYSIYTAVRIKQEGDIME